MIICNSLKLFPHIPGYLFIFANTEMYSLLRVLLYDYATNLLQKVSRRDYLYRFENMDENAN